VLAWRFHELGDPGFAVQDETAQQGAEDADPKSVQGDEALCGGRRACVQVEASESAANRATASHRIENPSRGRLSCPEGWGPSKSIRGGL